MLATLHANKYQFYYLLKQIGKVVVKQYLEKELEAGAMVTD